MTEFILKVEMLSKKSDGTLMATMVLNDKRFFLAAMVEPPPGHRAHAMFQELVETIVKDMIRNIHPDAKIDTVTIV